MPSVEKILTLNSDNSIYNSNYDFVFNLNRTINNIISIRVMNYSIPVANYNISSYNANNTLKFKEASNTYTITIPDGVYDATDISNKIQLLMNASGCSNTYTVSFSDINQKLTFLGNVTEFTVLSSSSIKDMIGIGESDLTSTSYTLTLANPCDLLYDKYYEIKLVNLIRNYTANSSNLDDDTIITIPLAGVQNFSYIKNDYYLGGLKMQPLSRNINNIVVSLVNQNGYSPNTDFDIYSFNINLILEILE